MSRIKAGMALLLGLFLAVQPAFAESDRLISEEMIREETVNYRTAEAESGVFEKTFSSGAVIYYPYTYNLRFEQAGAKFEDYLVRVDNEVRTGDVLATFTRSGDGVELVSQRLALENAVEDLEAGKQARKKAIEELVEGLSAVTDDYEKEILTLRIQRAELELEQYVYQQERRIADLQERVEELEEEAGEAELTAPVDGVIVNTLYKREGDRVYSSEVLVSMYRTDGMMLRVDNGSGNFRYGMRVTIEIGPTKQRQTLTGRVVGSDLLIPEKMRTNHAYIAIDPCDMEDLRWVNPTVTVSNYYLENVTVIPRKATKAENGKYYVTKLKDGSVQKRYVNFAMQSVDISWVLQGLEVGETVILD